MADAIRRLRALPEWEEWITFCVQGMGHDADSEHFAEIRMRRDELELDKRIDVELVIQQAGVAGGSLSEAEGRYTVARGSPVEAARVMDVIFRRYLGIRPHADRGNDYAIGAEW